MQTQMINFSIPKPLLSALDQQAENELKTRSQLLRDAISAYLRKTQLLEEILSTGKKQAKKLGITQDQVEDIIDDYRQGK